MPAAVIDNPILNSPFAEPSSHWELDENGVVVRIPHGEIARANLVHRF